jgi:hypothetical protein
LLIINKVSPMLIRRKLKHCHISYLHVKHYMYVHIFEKKADSEWCKIVIRISILKNEKVYSAMPTSWLLVHQFATTALFKTYIDLISLNFNNIIKILFIV